MKRSNRAMIQANGSTKLYLNPHLSMATGSFTVCFSIVSSTRSSSGSADLCLQTSGSRAQRDDFSCRRLCSVGDRLSCWYHSLVQQRWSIFRIIVCLFKRQPNLQRPFRLAQSHLIENCFGQSFKTSRKRRGFKKLFQQPSQQSSVL